MRTYTLIVCILSAWAFADQPANTNRFSLIDRSIMREPKYEGTPKYCLLVVDRDFHSRVWMVEDGDRLFLDRNGNGDLTDDGGPMPLRTDAVGILGYSADAITTSEGVQHTKFNMCRWKDGEDQNGYGLSLFLSGTRQVYAGWFGTFWAEKREYAPVVHLGGVFTPEPLRAQRILIQPGARRFDIGFINSGSQKGAETWLGTESLPADLQPVLKIDWPTKDGAPSIQTSHPLPQRCCYWDFYTTDFDIPSNIVPGKARIVVELGVLAPPIPLSTHEFTVPVELPKLPRKE